MDIEKKFSQGAESKTYVRIDGTYKTNIYLGYSEDGKMSMVVVSSGKETLVKSSKVIEVTLRRRKDNDMALSFELLDNSYKSLFYVFCKDIISISEKSERNMVISNILTRWKYWKDMFGKRKSDLLSKSEIKGLIGELIELRDHFLAEFEETVAIQSWMGPILGHKDFEVDDTWYEIKSVNENAVQVKINSLEQLESEVDGHLVVMRIEDSTLTSKLSFDLNKIVCSVLEKIENPENKELFTTRLDNVGYVYNPGYENFCFEYKGKQTYSVTEGFPRLSRKDINPSIGNAEYTILLDGIYDFKES